MTVLILAMAATARNRIATASTLLSVAITASGINGTTTLWSRTNAMTQVVACFGSWIAAAFGVGQFARLPGMTTSPQAL